MLNLVRTFTFWLFVKFSNIHATCWTWSELSLSKLLSKYLNIHAKCWTLSELLLSGLLQSVLKKNFFGDTLCLNLSVHDIIEYLKSYVYTKPVFDSVKTFTFWNKLRLSCQLCKDNLKWFFPQRSYPASTVRMAMEKNILHR